MNRYALICRLFWPAMLIMTGMLALLNQANILRWDKSWPLYLILWGVLKLAQRAALANCEIEAYPGPYGQPPVPPSAPVETSTAVVPAVPSAPEPREWRP